MPGSGAAGLNLTVPSAGLAAGAAYDGTGHGSIVPPPGLRPGRGGRESLTRRRRTSRSPHLTPHRPSTLTRWHPTAGGTHAGRRHRPGRCTAGALAWYAGADRL